MAKYQNDEPDMWLPVSASQADTEARVFLSGPLLETDNSEKQLGYTSTEERLDETELDFSSAFLPRTSVWAKLSFRFWLFWVGIHQFLTRCFRQESEAGTGFLWLPVFFGLGCISYFNLPREPLPFAFALAAVCIAIVCFKFKNLGFSRVCLIALCTFCLGAATSQLRVQAVDVQMLQRPVIVTLSGLVKKVERRADGRVRYTILPELNGAKDALPDNFLGLVRVTARPGGPQIETGARLLGKARLSAPSGPAYPGGYSFAFQSWFDGIGASGFFLGAPKRLDGQIDSAWPSVNQMREKVVAIIREALPNQSGALAAALIVGDRSGIDEETAEALRLSGLAHILAISGLHMALLSATVIALIRLIFSTNSNLVLSQPIKKWAAGAALVAASFYFLLSGGSVATQRAWIMVGIMLVAVMMDQRALTMRNVAIAALIVLAITPEAILMPGFQMSFAAVTALVASYEVLTKRAQKKYRNTSFQSHSYLKRFFIKDIGGLAMTSLVAGVATGLFAAYHFHRVAPLGLLANLAAMPLVSLIVMPLALVSVLAMPFGLEAYPLGIMAWGVEGVVSVATWISANGPQGNTGILPIETLLLATLGLLVLCLMKSRIRLAGLGIIGLAIAVAGTGSKPDILILENGLQVGILTEQGELQLSRPRAEKFSSKVWKRAYLTENTQENFLCDQIGCSQTIKGITVSHFRTNRISPDDCHFTDILVVPFDGAQLCSEMPENERPLIVDGPQLKRYGAHAIRIARSEEKNIEKTLSDKASRQDLITVTRTFPNRLRPWTQHRTESVLSDIGG